MAGLAFFTSCKPADEVTPTAGKPDVTITFDKANYGIQKDFKVSATVSTTGDSAYITLISDGESSKPTGAIYIMYQKDNETAVKFKEQPNGQVIPSAGYVGSKPDGTSEDDFNYNGNDYTFNIPNSLNTSWKLTFPIKLRKDVDNPESDVFTIWVTKDGERGRFDNPAKNLAYGLATVTFNYTDEKLINNYQTVLANSACDTIGSLFSSQSGSNYQREFAQSTTGIGSTIDFAYNVYKKSGETTASYFFGSFYTSTGSTDSDITAFFGSVTNISNFTHVAATTLSSADFDAIEGDASLVTAVNTAIGTSTTNKVVYSSAPTDKVFAFETASGKKGLVRVNSVSGGITETSTGTDGFVDINVKVQR